MKKTVLINQPAGLGDIIFCQKIYRKFIEMGHSVIWPIIDEFLWINEYTDLKYVSNSNFQYKDLMLNIEPIENENFIYLPLCFADKLFSNRIMESKYLMLDMDYSDWDQYFNFKRNIEKENDLYYNVLGLNDDDNYCFISKNYGSPPHSLKYNIEYTGNLKVIEMDYINGFTLFDWCKVFENANELHMIDSSLNFIIDKLNLKSDNLNLYTRRPNNFSEIDYIFKTKYNFCN